MPTFGRRSLENLETLDWRLRAVLLVAIREVDFGIIYGWRDEATQNRLVAEGRSKLRWPKSAHNATATVRDITGREVEVPASRAADCYLWVPGRGYIFGNGNVLGSVTREREAMTYFAGRLLQIGDILGVRLVWGGDWDSDLRSPNRFDDFGHFEVREGG